MATRRGSKANLSGFCFCVALLLMVAIVICRAAVGSAATRATGNPLEWKGHSWSVTSGGMAGVVNVIDAARSVGVTRIVNFQTVLCYGRPQSVPIPVDHPLRPFPRW